MMTTMKIMMMLMTYNRPVTFFVYEMKHIYLIIILPLSPLISVIRSVPPTVSQFALCLASSFCASSPCCFLLFYWLNSRRGTFSFCSVKVATSRAKRVCRRRGRRDVRVSFLFLLLSGCLLVLAPGCPGCASSLFFFFAVFFVVIILFLFLVL